MKEYFLTFWGQIENDNIVERELGIKEKNFWFNTTEEREKFKKKLQDLADKFKVIIAFREEEGDKVQYRTVADVKLKYRGKKYQFEYDFGYGYPEDSARFIFFEGNYSCDCNKSIFIQRYGKQKFKKMCCGDEIKIIDFKVLHVI